jgi:hypothetical protein
MGIVNVATPDAEHLEGAREQAEVAEVLRRVEVHVHPHGSIALYSPECLEELFSEVRMAPIRYPWGSWVLNLLRIASQGCPVALRADPTLHLHYLDHTVAISIRKRRSSS